MKNQVLIISDKPDLERDGLAKIWEKKGGKVLRVGKFWIKPEVGNYEVSIYGNDSFSLVLAQILELEMLMPRDEGISEVEHEFIKREVNTVLVEHIDTIQFPRFIKPAIPKLFKAKVFNNLIDLEKTIKGIENHQTLICSEIIGVSKEVRSFILDKKILDLSFYEGTGNLQEAESFILKFINTSNLTLPKSYVLDIGFNENLGWFIIEFNSSWGAGLNGCNPEKVLDAIKAASIN